ncbi:MAG: polysaccharide export protein [Methylococcales symbiont of Hymedesmia sp. n. MRB-2018]|nr:MAG: polysaccharide export protein [Methylococcales symbiont of Hymedesmia sp. n. MRB-2018]
MPTLLYAQSSYNYTLDVGDKIRITVFNQKDLTGEYVIDGSGGLSLPLIGAVTAKGLSLKDLEKIIHTLKPNFLLNPKVSVQVLNYRPFYILGEVEKPNSCPYVNGMTYLNAVAITGGFTYRAKDDRVFVVHNHKPKQDETQMTPRILSVLMNVFSDVLFYGFYNLLNLIIIRSVF